MVAVKENPAPAKKVKTSAEVLPSTSGPKPIGTGIQTATQKGNFKSVDLRNDLEAFRISRHRFQFVNNFVRMRVADLQWRAGDEDHLQKRLQNALATEGLPPMTQDKLLQTARHIISKCNDAREKALGTGKYKGVGKKSSRRS